MTTVTKITGAVKRLPKKELARFRKWFVEYDAAAWDKQIESDVAAGKGDPVAGRRHIDDYGVEGQRTEPMTDGWCRGKPSQSLEDRRRRAGDQPEIRNASPAAYVSKNS